MTQLPRHRNLLNETSSELLQMKKCLEWQFYFYVFKNV
jgi:hypothetical protein